MKLRQFYGLYRREMMRFLSVPAQTLGTPVVSGALYLLIFGVSVGDAIRMQGATSYLAFLIPGLVSLALLRNTFDNTASSMISGKYTNELQDLRVSPLSSAQIIWGITLASFTRGLIVGTLTYLVGLLFLFLNAQPISWIHKPFFLFIFLFLTGISFAQLGMIIAMKARSFEHMGIFGSFVLTPLIYLGGVFFTLKELPIFWQWAALCNPLHYFISGIRFGIYGVSETPVAISLGISVIFFFITHFGAHLVVNRGENYFR